MPLLTGNTLPYDSYTGDSTHRLFEMWQQSDCSIRNATFQNPSGCLSDLYPFVISPQAIEKLKVVHQVIRSNGRGGASFAQRFMRMMRLSGYF